MTAPSPDAPEPPALDSTYRQLIEAVARGWWDALDTDAEIDWGDIVDLCMYISDATPPAETDFAAKVRSILFAAFSGNNPISREAAELEIVAAWQAASAAQAKRIADLERERDEAEERSKACDQIAEGEEGWQVLRNICVSTMSVSALRDKLEAAEQRAKALGQLLAHIAHDIRSLIATPAETEKK